MLNTHTQTSLTADEAIQFALDDLQPFEVVEFLDDWRNGRPIAPWQAALQADQAFVVENFPQR